MQSISKSFQKRMKRLYWGKAKKMVAHKGKSPHVKIKFYSGYKHQEIPRSCIINDKEYNIMHIIWRKRFWDKKTGETAELFKCILENKKEVQLYISPSGNHVISFPPEFKPSD